MRIDFLNLLTQAYNEKSDFFFFAISDDVYEICSVDNRVMLYRICSGTLNIVCYADVVVKFLQFFMLYLERNLLQLAVQPDIILSDFSSLLI